MKLQNCCNFKFKKIWKTQLSRDNQSFWQCFDLHVRKLDLLSEDPSCVGFLDSCLPRLCDIFLVSSNRTFWNIASRFWLCWFFLFFCWIKCKSLFRCQQQSALMMLLIIRMILMMMLLLMLRLIMTMLAAAAAAELAASMQAIFYFVLLPTPPLSRTFGSLWFFLWNCCAFFIFFSFSGFMFCAAVFVLAAALMMLFMLVLFVSTFLHGVVVAQ